MVTVVIGEGGDFTAPGDRTTLQNVAGVCLGLDKSAEIKIPRDRLRYGEEGFVIFAPIIGDKN